MVDRTMDFAIFKKAQNDMVAKNAASWNEYYGYTRSQKVKNYTKEEVDKIINGTSLTAQQDLSRNYFNKDGFYKRLILHYATLLTYSGILIPKLAAGKNIAANHINKRYYQALSYVDDLQLSTIFTNITKIALVDGSYFGFIQAANKSEFILLDLPSGYCRSRFKDLYGNDIVEFNVNYFYTITDNDNREAALATYPPVIASHFRKYDKGKTTNYWVMLPVGSGISFSLFDDMRPLFLSVIPATIQYDDAIETERERELEEIRKIIVQKIPHLTDGQLLFEPEEAVEMHTGAVGMMKGNKNLSILTTYADVDAIVSKTTNENTSSALDRMLQNIYANGGVSQQIFAPQGVQAVKTSIINDISLMMVLANKYSTFITTILNQLFSNTNIKFTYKILPISYHTQSDCIKDYLKLAQSGYSFLLPSIASGISQYELTGLKALENDLLELNNILIPLSSSFTQSADAGAPQKATEDKSEKTIENEDSINNNGGTQ